MGGLRQSKLLRSQKGRGRRYGNWEAEKVESARVGRLAGGEWEWEEMGEPGVVWRLGR
jgi:hypothetical protein